MRSVRCCYKKTRIEDVLIAFLNVFGRHGIHMVDYDSVVNLSARNSEVTTVISGDYNVSHPPPLS